MRKASTLKMRLVLNTYAYADIALRTKPGYLNAQKPRTETEEKEPIERVRGRLDGSKSTRLGRSDRPGLHAYR